MAYTPQTWHDAPATDTPITAARLAVMEAGIAASVPNAASVTADGGTPGYLMKFDHNYFDSGTGNEPVIFNGQRSATAKRAFWLNENCSPRAASINDEPALKLFGPAMNTAYAGQVFEVLNRWDGSGSQVHLWGIGMDGNPRVGTGNTVGANIITLAAAASVPAGLPAGTVIVRGSGTTPTFRGFASTGISATSGNITLPTGSQAGDWVLLIGMGVSTGTTVTLGSGLTSLYQAVVGTGRAVIASKQLTATDITNGNLSVTHADANNIRYGIVGYYNCGGFGTLGTPTIRPGSSVNTTADGDSVATTVGQWVAVMRVDKVTSNPGPASVTPATTLRGEYYVNAASAPSVWMGDYVSSGTIGTDRTFTDSVASANGMGVQIALLGPAASAPSLSLWDGAAEIAGFNANSTTVFTNKTIGDKLDFTSVTPPAAPSVGTTRFFARTGVSGLDAPAWQNSLGLPMVIGRDIGFFAKNISGATLTKGTAVYIQSATASVVNVNKAQADATGTKLPAVGVLAADITNNTFGLVMQYGVVQNLNTSGFTDGAMLYVDATTAGALTATRPAHPAVGQQIGVCINSNGSTGSILVTCTPQNPSLFQGTNGATWGIGDGTGSGAKSVQFKNTNTGTLQWTPTAARTITLPDVTTTLDGIDNVATLTNKTLTSPVLTTPTINGATNGTGVTAAATANTLVLRDTNAMATIRNVINTVDSTVTASGTTVMTNTKGRYQVFTGTQSQTITLATTSVVIGLEMVILNLSTGVLTVNASGGGLVATVPVSGALTVAANQATPTLPAHWTIIGGNVVRNITVNSPNPGSLSASMFLVQTGQTWEFFNNTGGQFGVWDGTNGVQPFTINPNTPANALVMDSTGVTLRRKARVATVASTATPTINIDLYDQSEMLTLVHNITSLGATGTPNLAQVHTLVFKSAAAQTINLGAGVIAGPAPLLTATVAGKYHEVVLKFNGTRGAWIVMASDAVGY